MSDATALPDAMTALMAMNKQLEDALAEKEEADRAETLRQSKMCACVEAACIIAAADGGTSADEVSNIVDRVVTLADGAVSRDDVMEMVESAKGRVEAEGRDDIINSICERCDTEDDRTSAFIVAANVSWAGGGIGAQEGLALQAISKAFGWEMSHMHRLLGAARS